MKLALVANHASGSADVDLDEIARLVADDGRNDVRDVDLADLAEADLSGVDRLVVAGGDGTVGLAARSALQAGSQLAVVPCGTANDFARAMSITRDAPEAARRAARATGTTTVEVAVVEDGPFVNLAACGLTTKAARDASWLKTHVGPLAYAIGAIQAGFSEHSITARVEVDGEVIFHGAAWQVMVAASGAYGGGARVAPADPTDMRLDVSIVPRSHRLALFKRAWGMRNGTLHEQDGIVHGRGAEIVVEGPRDYNIDGELRPLDRARFSVCGTVEVVA